MKKLKGIVLVVILLLASIMMPFDIYADTLTTSNITYNYYLTDVVDSTSQLADKNYIYDVDFIFDKSYLGWVSVSMVTSYVFAVGDTRQATFTKAIYVNGNTAKTSIVLSSNYTGTNGSPLTSMSISINNSNVTPLADLSSLQDIIDLLQDIDDHVYIDILEELQNVVSNTSLANDYLETLTEMVQYHYPIESFQFIFEQIKNGYELDNILENYYYDYPVFNVPANSSIYRFYGAPERKVDIIFGINFDYSSSQVLSYMNIPNGYTANVISSNLRGINVYRFYHIQLVPNNEVVTEWKNISFIRQYKIIPIFIIDYLRNYNVSTEFALQWGLTNRLLDDIHIIANGTNQSSEVASDLESGNSQMADDMDDLATIENEYNQQFNNQLQQIDFTSPLQNNAGILPAANFVITIFNGLINNNPFSVLIIIVCILLIGKKVIGK